MENIENLDDLIAEFVQRVNQDIIEFGIDSVFMPNPVISTKPKFCFIGMEPSTGGLGIPKLKALIEEGHLNFLYSEEDFILHYCAFHYLCDQSFDYAITDISKGAMNVKLATLNSNLRYEKWLPLLVMEWELMNNPISIAIGKGLKNKMNELHHDPDHTILHYSWNNSKWIKDAQVLIENESPKNDFDNFEKLLKQFSIELMEKMGYTKSMIDKVIVKFSAKLPEWKKALLALYRYNFRNISRRH